jgi:hypothetical protein
MKGLLISNAKVAVFEFWSSINFAGTGCEHTWQIFVEQ